MKINLTNHHYPVTPEPGIYHGVSYEEYDRWNAFRKSMVGPALRSGKHLEAFIKRGKKTAALSFGSLVDCLILEPELYSDRYVFRPSTYDKEITRGRGAGKTTSFETKKWNTNSHTCQAIEKRLRQSGKEIITGDDYERAVAIKYAVMSNLEMKRAIEYGKKQVSIVWHEPNTGVLCKGRIDLLLTDTIDDLKTAVDASPGEFSRVVANFLYHVQAGTYTQAIKILTGVEMAFRFIVAETGGLTSRPIGAIYRMEHNDESMVAGRLMFKRACEKIVEYEERGIEGYSVFPEPITIPRWAIEREFAHHEEIEL